MKLPKQCVTRLYKYRDALQRFKTLGFLKIFSDDLADALSVTSVQVRKDFSLFGISGNKRGGYLIDSLLTQLNHLLGKDKVNEVVLVGAGHIGRALMHYDGFEKEGIIIKAAFDIDPLKYGQETKIPILPLEELAAFVKKNNIRIAIIAVPYFAAQQIVDVLISAGIRGVLNFAPMTLKVPEDFFVNNVDVRLELETVTYFVHALNKNKNHKNSKDHPLTEASIKGTHEK
jgi:redox-sensing transcriptional repressor